MTTTKPATKISKKPDYIVDDMLGQQYLGDSKASPYCKDIIRIENPVIRSAFAILIASGCKGSDVDNFILALAKKDYRYLEILIDHKTPLSNATQFKMKLSKGFDLPLKKQPKKLYRLSDEINTVTNS